MPLFVYVLSLAVFAQGTSEFMLAGLVPGIAHDMSVSVAAAASLTSAYAIGMIVGAPPMAALSARWPRRRALAGFLAAFIVVHVIGAVTASFPCCSEHASSPRSSTPVSSRSRCPSRPP